MTSSTDADRILGTGVLIKLSDGSTVTLRYGMLGVREIDAHFGSVSDMLTQLNGTLTTPLADPLSHAVSFGLRHRAAEARHTPQALIELDLLDTTLMEDYIEAVLEAVMQAFPHVRRAVAVAEAEKAAEATAAGSAGSPGLTGSTPAPSSSDGPTTTSVT